MSNLPGGWRVERLGDIAQEVRGSVTALPGMAYELWSVPSFAVGRPEYVDGSVIGSAKRPVQPDDVLLCKINPRINRVWIVGSRPPGSRQLASTEWLILRTSMVLPRYLKLYLASPEFRDWIVTAVSGVTGSHTRAKSGAILDRVIPVPCLEEQRRIVEILEDHLSRLDAAGASVTLASRRVYGWSEAFLERFTNAKWPTVRIGQLASVGSGATPSRSRRDYYEGGGIPWVTSGALNEPFVSVPSGYITELALTETAVKLWPPGTLLVAMYGEGKTRGRCSELTFASTTNQACAAIVLAAQHAALTPWIKLVLRARYQHLRRMAAGGVQPNLSLGLIRDMEIPIPSLPVRAAAIAKMTEIDSVAARLSAQLQSAGERSERLRRALLAAAFSGRLTGRASDEDVVQELAGV